MNSAINTLSEVVTNNAVSILTPSDIQKIFKMGRNQAYNLMNSDGFPTIRINNRLYVEQGALMSWLKKNRGRKYTV